MARDRQRGLARRLVVLLLVMASSCVLAASAEENISTSVDSCINRIIDLTITQRYDSALASCDRLKSLPSGMPYGYFLQAAVLQSRMLDYENDVGKEDFFAASEKARWLFQRRLREQPRSAICHFFIGATYGYEAFYYAKRGRLFDGFRTGWRCLQELHVALEIDPKLYDAYLGIGTYRYYQAKLGKHFAWLPLIEDNREAAIRMIRQAIDHGRYSKYAAINGLSWILIDEGRAGEALALVDSALAEFPQSRFFLWGAAESYVRLKNWQEAQRYYELILQSLAEENHPSPYNEIMCYFRLAQIYFQQTEYAACRRKLAELLAMPLNKEDRERGEKIIKQARALQKEVEKYN